MSNGPHHSERRGHRRVSSTLDIRYGTHGEFQRAKVCDICPAGLALAGPVAYAVGTDVELRFQPADQPRGDMLLVRASVRHCTDNRMGLKFIDRTDAERRHILRLIEHMGDAAPQA